MHVSDHYVVVEKIEQTKAEGFEVVAVTDDFVYRGKVTILPDVPVHMGNYRINLGDVVLFAKYSPDSHEIEHEGKKLKFVSIKDILSVV